MAVLAWLPWRSRPGYTCPSCRTFIPGAEAARLGHCGTCQAFTGLCAAGRRGGVRPPDMLRIVTGATPWSGTCESAGTDLWHVEISGREMRVLLCAVHSGTLQAWPPRWMAARQLTAEGTA